MTQAPKTRHVSNFAPQSLAETFFLLQYWTNYYPTATAPPPLPQATGKKKALLIGINCARESFACFSRLTIFGYYHFPDFGSKSQLKGCINDARNVYQLLTRSGYPAELIHFLADDAQDPSWMPTRANIIRCA